jgi:hypothetical protein
VNKGWFWYVRTKENQTAIITVNMEALITEKVGERQKEKELTLKTIREKVDGLYTIHNAGREDKHEKAFVDEGIKDAVVYLMALGFRTYDSCYGHPELTPPVLEKISFFRATPVVKIDTPLFADYQDETSNMTDAEFDEMRREALEIESRSNALLTEFYKDRPVAHEECRIINERWHDDNCFRNKGEDTITEEQVKVGRGVIHPLVAESRVEWNDFTKFLEQYYMGEG